MLLYAKQPRGKGRWVAPCAGAGGEAWTPCSLNKHKDHCGPTGKDKEEDLIFSRRFSHVDSKLMLQLKYLEPNSALSHARFSWFIPKPKQCNRDQNLAPAFLNCCYPITNFHLCPWVTNGIFILFFFKLRTWFWTRNELCVQGCQSGRVDTRAEAELEAQSWSELCTRELAVCLEEGAAGCAVWGAHQNLLGQGEMGPFGTGVRSVLRSASGVCSIWNPRWCRGQWKLPSFNAMGRAATFQAPRTPFPALF